MSEAVINTRRRVPLWVQVPIWLILTAVLVLVGMGLRRTEQGTAQPGDKIPDFGLTFFRDYEYNGAPAIKISAPG